MYVEVSGLRFRIAVVFTNAWQTRNLIICQLVAKQVASTSPCRMCSNMFVVHLVSRVPRFLRINAHYTEAHPSSSLKILSGRTCRGPRSKQPTVVTCCNRLRDPIVYLFGAAAKYFHQLGFDAHYSLHCHVIVRAPPHRRLVDVLRLCAMLLSQNQCTRLLSMPGLVQIAAESQTGSMAVAQAGARSCHLTRSRASR